MLCVFLGGWERTCPFFARFWCKEHEKKRIWRTHREQKWLKLHCTFLHVWQPTLYLVYVCNIAVGNVRRSESEESRQIFVSLPQKIKMRRWLPWISNCAWTPLGELSAEPCILSWTLLTHEAQGFALKSTSIPLSRSFCFVGYLVLALICQFHILGAVQLWRNEAFTNTSLCTHACAVHIVASFERSIDRTGWKRMVLLPGTLCLCWEQQWNSYCVG